MKMANCHPQAKHCAKGFCKPCYNRQLLANNPELKTRSATASEKSRQRPVSKLMHKSTTLKRRYGITLEQRDALFAKQGGLCRLCKKSKPLVVEHNHVTKRVRGLTCNKCNMMVAHIENNIGIMHEVFAYIYFVEDDREHTTK